MNELAPNTMLYNGKYKIQKVLGQGTFGITYLATDTRDNRDVTIKEFFMKETNTRGEDSTVTGAQSEIFKKYKDKFHIEAINLSKMSGYDDIITVYEAFEDNNTAYYAMEYIDGGSLNEYISANGKLPEDEAIRNIRMVATALHRLHNSRMLHLDLKPGNIMRRRNGVLILIDFGLSKQYDADGKAESSSTIGLGSPGYAPIEQSNFNGEFAPTLDIYALGATLYKMLTGKTAPVSTDIFNDGFIPLANRMRASGASNKTIKIVEKAMQLKKFNRYQSVDEFLKALPDENEPEIIEAEMDDCGTIYKPKNKNINVKSTNEVNDCGRIASFKCPKCGRDFDKKIDKEATIEWLWITCPKCDYKSTGDRFFTTDIESNQRNFHSASFLSASPVVKKSLSFKCPKCGRSIHKTVDADATIEWLWITCPQCDYKSTGDKFHINS